MTNKHIGSSVESFFAKEGFLAEVTALAGKKVADYVLAEATRILGTEEAAMYWLSMPTPSLPGRAKPIDLLSTPGGCQLVLDLLVRIEHGVYT